MKSHSKQKRRYDFFSRSTKKCVKDGELTRQSKRSSTKLERNSREGGCRWFAFTGAEFDEVLRCTAPWKACGVDSVYSFQIKKCPTLKKAVYQLVKKMVEWKIADRWDEENSLLLEGRTELLFNGGDMKDPANSRPITCLPTITKMVTLAIHKRMQNTSLATVK